jgi:hypothetical protein
VAAVFVGAAATMLAGGGTERMEAAPAAGTGGAAQTDDRERAQLREDGKPRQPRSGQTKLLRQKALGPLLAP